MVVNLQRQIVRAACWITSANIPKRHALRSVDHEVAVALKRQKRIRRWTDEWRGPNHGTVPAAHLQVAIELEGRARARTQHNAVRRDDRRRNGIWLRQHQADAQQREPNHSCVENKFYQSYKLWRLFGHTGTATVVA
jgi:hypothetical protein